MARLFRDYPEAIARTDGNRPSAAGSRLDELRYEYPDEATRRWPHAAGGAGAS